MSKQEVEVKKEPVVVAPPQLSPEMQAYLAEQEAGVSNRLKHISTAGATFTYDEQPIPNNSLAVIILDYIVTNVLYRTKHDKDNPTPPNCFAFGRGNAVMVPHQDAIEKVAKNCNVCTLSKFGSAKEIEWKKSDRGCGCNMKRRLALLCIGEVLKDGKIKLDASTIDESEICYLNVPVTSVKYFEAYKGPIVKVRKLPLCYVPTQIGIVNDKETMWKMTFKEIKTAVDMYGAEHPVSLLDPETMGRINARHVEARAFIETPYTAFNAPDEVDDVIDTRKEKF
jgi:hypothetical protein